MLMDDANPRPRPVSVVRAGGDATTVGRLVAATHSGPSIDLRTPSEPIVADDIRRTATEVAGEDLATRSRAHEEQASDLRAAVDAADSARRVADAAVDARQAEQRRLAEGAAWCDDRRAAVPDLVAAVAAAEAVEVEAHARLAAADARLAEVTEQRAAAEGVLGQARRQLAGLEVAGRSENDVRRSLEAAGQRVRDAEVALAAAAAEVEQAAAAVATAEARLAAAEDDLGVQRSVAAGDPDVVAEALSRFLAAPQLPVDPDDLALADEIERMSAAASAGDPDPAAVEVDRASLAVAEQAIVDARAAVEAARRPVESAVPEWWGELGRLHTEVVESLAALDGTFGRKAAQRRYEDAVAAERDFLDELGFPSHLDALMAGGRAAGQRRDPAAAGDAARALAEAEATFIQVRTRVDRADQHRRIAAELERLRAEAAQRLGVAPADLDPADLRRTRPDPAPAAELAAAMGVTGAPDHQLAAIARAWRAEHDRVVESLPAAEAEQRSAAAALRVARAAADEAAAAARAAEEAADEARREVEVLESELGSRMDAESDPAARAVSAAALRDRIEALEARVTSAESAAADERTGAAAAVAEATVALVDAQRALVDVVTRLTALGQIVDAAPPRTDDLAADLEVLADVLRSSADVAASAIGADVEASAAAGAATEEARAALERHLAEPPGLVADASLAEAVRRLLHPATRATDVVVDPLGAAGDERARTALLEAIIAAGLQRPVIVVTDDPTLLSWAIELSTDVGGLVPLAALQSSRRRADNTNDPATATGHHAG
jgi:hypothetical protein